eukprot:5607924-Prymnesium_polylepis.3
MMTSARSVHVFSAVSSSLPTRRATVLRLPSGQGAQSLRILPLTGDEASMKAAARAVPSPSVPACSTFRWAPTRTLRICSLRKGTLSHCSASCRCPFATRRGPA